MHLLPKLILVFAIPLLIVPVTLTAQLPTRTEQLTQRYQETRAQGLMRLNEQYITAFQQELAGAMRGNRLEEANRIKQQIEKLQAQNQELSEALNSSAGKDTGTTAESGRDDENQLGKRTISFPDTTEPDFTVTVDFERDWTAIWLGRAGVKVPQTYRREGPGEYYFWPADEPPGVFGWKVKVSPDEKTAVLTNVRYKNVVEAKIERTR